MTISDRNVISFKESKMVGHVPDLTRGGEFIEVPLVQRIDPIFGSRARIIEGSKLTPNRKSNIKQFLSSSGFCPFCADHVENATFPFPSAIVRGGKIWRGSSLVVPNIVAYSSYSAVGIYDTTRHFIELDQFDAHLISDVLISMFEHTKLVRNFDPRAEYSSINANYLPPSGSSLTHPHVQSSHDEVPLGKQATLSQRSTDYFVATGRRILQDLVDAERNGPRYVGKFGEVTFVAAFAPSGFREIWGVIHDATDITDISIDSAKSLAEGLLRVFACYSDWNLSSFNFSIAGGGNHAAKNGFIPLLRVVARSNPEPYYRSDVTYFEKLYDEAMVDVSPEDTASELRRYFIV